MDDILISIIVPIYNVEKYLERCLNSLINQDFNDKYEIILVNDGSPDNSIKICEQFVKKNKNIRLINKKNEGLGFARNTGLENASGKYVVFVDSDDFVTSDMLSYLYNTIVRENADIVYASHIKYYSEKDLKKKYDEKSNEKVIMESSIEDFRLDMIANSVEKKEDTPTEVSVWSAIFRMDIIKNNNVKFVSEREYISEDVIFNIDLYKYVKKIIISDKKIYYYCFNLESLSKCYKEDRFLKDLKLYFHIREMLCNDYETEKLNQRLYRFLIARIRCAIGLIVFSESKIGKKNCSRLINDIIENEEVRNVCQKFKYKKLGFLQKIFFINLKKQKIDNLYFLCKLNNIRNS